MDRSWKRSSRCDTGSCVEAALVGETVHVRDAQTEELTISSDAWTQFLEGVKNGEFDRR